MIKHKTLSDSTIRKKLNEHYKLFDKSSIAPDPVQFLHKFSEEKDIEIAGIISSVFSYGNVQQIIKTLEKIFEIIENKPYEFVEKFNYSKDAEVFANIVHRFYTSEDIARLFRALHRIYTEDGSLKQLFLMYYFPQEKNLKDAVAFFSRNLLDAARGREEASQGLTFMFPDPAKGSACKRMNLFLRWMIRKDEIDFGLWKEIPPDKLVIPVDTHVTKICKELNLTAAKNISWGMAEEITENLKKFDPCDPVKYDFAICHIGMRKLKF